MFDLKYWSRIKKGFSTVTNSLAYDLNTQIYNPRSDFDLQALSRGIIAGCIVVSAPGIYFKLWISIILGSFGGFIVVGSSQLL
jgi:ammonia channel protein AmtB